MRAALLYAVATLLFFWPVLTGRVISQTDALYFMEPFASARPPGLEVPSNRMLDDQTREFLPFFLVARESIRRGELPLWNPSIFAGTPLLAESQSAVLFPLNFGHYVLPPPLGFTASALAKVFSTCWLTYLFARTLGIAHMAALVAGLAYAFSGFNVFWLSHPHTNVTLLLPLILLATENIARSPRPRAVAVLGCAVAASLLGGHVELTFLSAATASLWLAVRVLQDRTAVWPRLRAFVGAYVLGAAAGGVILVPFLELLYHSITWEIRSAHNPFFAPALSLVTLGVPDLYLLPGWAGGAHVLHGLSLYVGTASVVLALVGLTCARSPVGLACARSPVVLPLAVLVAAGALLGFGVWPLADLLVLLPLFRQNPNYYAVVPAMLALCVLAGLGMDALERATEASRRRRARLAVLVAFLAVAAALALLASGAGGWIVGAAADLGATDPGAVVAGLRATALGAFTWTALAAGAAVLSAGYGRRARWARRLLVCLVFADVFRAQSGWNPALALAHARPTAPESLSAIPRSVEPPRVAGIGGALPPNVGVYAGLHDVRGYDVPVVARYHRFFLRALGGRDVFWQYDLPTLTPAARPFLDMAGVEWIVDASRADGAAEAESDPGAGVFRNAAAYPRAYLVESAEVAPSSTAALERVLELGERLRRTVVIERPAGEGEEVVADAAQPGGRGGHADPRLLADARSGTDEPQPANTDGPAFGGATAPLPLAARITRYEPGRVEIDVEGARASWLVLTDTAYPGWRALVDGRETPIAVANALFRAVRLPPGAQSVTFVYKPWSVRIGIMLSLLGLVLGVRLWIRES